MSNNDEKPKNTEVDPEEAHRAVSSEFGKRGLGVPKVLTPEERARRADRMRQINLARSQTVQIVRGTAIRLEDGNGMVRAPK